jgi:hypothetical protein
VLSLVFAGELLDEIGAEKVLLQAIEGARLALAVAVAEA